MIGPSFHRQRIETFVFKVVSVTHTEGLENNLTSINFVGCLSVEYLPTIVRPWQKGIPETSFALGRQAALCSSSTHRGSVEPTLNLALVSA